MKKIILLVMAFSMLVTSNGFGKSKTIKYEPLVGSNWAQKHPGQLPYSSCYVYNGENAVWGTSTSSLGYGVEKYQDMFDEMVLVCFSKKLRLAYAIPVKFSIIQRGGLNVSIAGEVNLTSKTWMTRLGGKAVKDIFGRFKGGEYGLGVLGGFSYRKLKNKNGVFFQQVNGGLMLGQLAGYITFKLRPQKSLRAILGPKISAIMLFGDPSKLKRPSYWWDVPETVDWAAISNLRFVTTK
ncbi:MAG: hypothetical protein A2583_05050 [Bdellovibrionales bacterium RIFOXYD1_FULL_53_11]|nr:MAG: hypothetical protein A2583_05050 [Bdellovibrionales bacterium RIFOXYD1_FULL_53_11]